jgi:hypothetical protein
MTSIKALWTGGSLFTRTVLHVATFVLGSLAFVSLMSFALVSTAKGLLSARGGAATAASAQEEAPAVGAPAAAGARGPAAAKPSVKPRRLDPRAAAAREE